MEGRRTHQAPPDLFDGLPTPQLLEPERARKPLPRHSRQPELSLLRMLCVGLALALAGAALGLEVWLCLVLAALGPVTEAMRGRRLGSRLLWTAIVAGLCAQLTAIFATPFTWPLRFGFFSVLLGAGVGYYALQTDD